MIPQEQSQTVVTKSANILLSAQPGDSEYACVSSSAFCISLLAQSL